MALVPVFNSRNINGTWTSPTLKIPDSFNREFALRFNLSSSHYLNTTKSFDCRIDISSNGTDWEYLGGFGFKGGNWPDKDGNLTTPKPEMGFGNAPFLKGKYIRVRIITNSIINMGAEIEVA